MPISVVFFLLVIAIGIFIISAAEDCAITGLPSMLAMVIIILWMLIAGGEFSQVYNTPLASTTLVARTIDNVDVVIDGNKPINLNERLRCDIAEGQKILRQEYPTFKYGIRWYESGNVVYSIYKE